ncbi:MAG: hypothetical protein AAFP13_08440 [Pseudomonadota bacterium]
MLDDLVPPDSFVSIYESFLGQYGMASVLELDSYFEALLRTKDTDLGELWWQESKADYIFDHNAVRMLATDYRKWVAALDD